MAFCSSREIALNARVHEIDFRPRHLFNIIDDLSDVDSSAATIYIDVHLQIIYLLHAAHITG